MDHSIEKAYFCSKTEFLMLLGMAGAGQVYSFELPKREELTEEDLTLALYHLIKKGFLQMKDKPVLAPDLRQILKPVCQTQLALQVIPGNNEPQKICYLSGEYAAVTELCRESEELRLCLLERDELLRRLTAESELGRTLLQTEAEGRLLICHDETVGQEQETLSSGRLLSGKELSMLEPLSAVIEQDGVRSAWELFDRKAGAAAERFLFLEGSAFSWILKQTWESCAAVPDSLEAREELGRELSCLHIVSR